MHENDLVIVWDQWCRGEPLYEIATNFGMTCSRLHAELQVYLERQVAVSEMAAA